MSEYIIRPPERVDSSLSLWPIIVGEIVRCRDCMHATISTTGVCKYCEMFVLPDVDGYGADSQVNLPLDFFCGFAERKEGGDD